MNSEIVTDTQSTEEILVSYEDLLNKIKLQAYVDGWRKAESIYDHLIGMR